jgi:hypothetical protein
VPGDEAQDVSHVRNRPRTGPRHAAPKKALLTRLQIPAGKAIALAAMPTAVLMGMGLAPRFVAHADEMPGNDAFKAGPCVTASDKPVDDGKGTKAPKDDKPSKSPGTPAGSKGGKNGGGSPSKPGDPSAPPSPGAGASATPDPHTDKPLVPDTGKTSQPPAGGDSTASGDSGSGGSGSAKSNGLLDPILGTIGGILDPGGKGGKGGKGGDKPTTAPTATPGPSASSTPSGSSGSGKPSDGGASDGKASDGKAKSKDSKSLLDEAESLLNKGKDKGKDKDGDAKDGASPSPSQTLPTPDADGKIPYPCPTEDKVAGDDEQTPNLLPNEPWTLKASRLNLHGLQYDGVVNVKTDGGGTKQALKFRASGIDIVDLHQLVDGPLGVTMHIEAAKGSTSTIRGGEVTMYTESLSGNLLGLVPITFTPDFPPPLTLPELFFTNVTVVQAGQFGGNLTVPGLHGYSTNP